MTFSSAADTETETETDTDAKVEQEKTPDVSWSVVGGFGCDEVQKVPERRPCKRSRITPPTNGVTHVPTVFYHDTEWKSTPLEQHFVVQTRRRAERLSCLFHLKKALKLVASVVVPAKLVAPSLAPVGLMAPFVASRNIRGAIRDCRGTTQISGSSRSTTQISGSSRGAGKISGSGTGSESVALAKIVV